MCEEMKPYTNLRAEILLLAGVLLLCVSTVAATDQIAIDPVPQDLTTGSIIRFSGTTTLPAGTTLRYEFSRKESGTGAARYGEYSGAEGTITVEKGTAGQVWNVPVLTEGYAPADYIFRIGKDGSGDRVSVEVRLAAGSGTSVPTPQATKSSGCGELVSPVYVSPGGTFSVKTAPDLNARCNNYAKGMPLAITAAVPPGASIGIWITSVSQVTRFTQFQKISAGGSGTAEYHLPNTTAWKSGQYFIYVVDGEKSLEVQPDENNPSAYLSVDVLETKLKAYEKQNPYQKFMILLEEPVINLNKIPDAVSGTSVEMAGTTNLNAGTLLDIGVFPAENERPKQPAVAVTGIHVTVGTNGYGSWHAILDTSSLTPGEYIVKAGNGSTEATGLMVLYDRLYDPGASSGETLVVKTYDVDPETKTVVSGTPAQMAGLPADLGILVLSCFAGVICLGVVVNTIRKK